jgi:L-fucose mutarotase/ribose pyranase (RbsD/FucU family)
VCTKSKFCLLCPEANKDKLDAAIAKARQIANDFNATAEITTVEVNVLVGKISPDDVEAVKAINSEVRDLMDTMARGLAAMDVGVVREAARKAKSIGAMLEPNAQERVQKAIEVARAAATQIVKAGETGAVEIDQVSIQRITEARTSFLDLDDAVEVQAPVATVAEVDFDVEPVEFTAAARDSLSLAFKI